MVFMGQAHRYESYEKFVFTEFLFANQNFYCHRVQHTSQYMNRYAQDLLLKLQIIHFMHHMYLEVKETRKNK